jgi:hypothetical protein
MSDRSTHAHVVEGLDARIQNEFDRVIGIP